MESRIRYNYINRSRRTTQTLTCLVQHDVADGKCDVMSAPPYKHLQWSFSVHNMYFMSIQAFLYQQQSYVSILAGRIDKGDHNRVKVGKFTNMICNFKVCSIITDEIKLSQFQLFVYSLCLPFPPLGSWKITVPSMTMRTN